MNKTYKLFGVSAEPVTFTEVEISKHNTREITFTGKWCGIPIAVNNLKPSGLLFLDVSAGYGDISEPVGQASTKVRTTHSPLTGQQNLLEQPPVPVGQAPATPSGIPVGQAPATPVGTPDTPVAPHVGVKVPDTPVTREQLYNFGTKLYNSGKDVVNKGLVPLGYGQLGEVPDEKLQEVYDIMANDATWV